MQLLYKGKIRFSNIGEDVGYLVYGLEAVISGIRRRRPAMDST
jgi:hypothetical protein